MRILPALAVLALSSISLAPAWAKAPPPLEIKHDQTSNPGWLSITVKPIVNDLYWISLYVKPRKDIGPYRLTLLIAEGRMNGLRVDVPVTRGFKADFTAGMTLPREIVSNGILVLTEVSALQPDGRTYRIDLGSYLDRAVGEKKGRGDADTNRIALARKVLRAKNKRLERAIKQMIGGLAAARIADPEKLAQIHSHISATAAARDLNTAILASDDEELLMTAAKAIIHAIIEEKYDGIFHWKATTTDENPSAFAPNIRALRRDIRYLKAKLGVLENRAALGDPKPAAEP